jgi:hypothetical protein
VGSFSQSAQLESLEATPGVEPTDAHEQRAVLESLLGPGGMLMVVKVCVCCVVRLDSML